MCPRCRTSQYLRTFINACVSLRYMLEESDLDDEGLGAIKTAVNRTLRLTAHRAIRYSVYGILYTRSKSEYMVYALFYTDTPVHIGRLRACSIPCISYVYNRLKQN